MNPKNMPCDFDTFDDFLRYTCPEPSTISIPQRVKFGTDQVTFQMKETKF